MKAVDAEKAAATFVALAAVFRLSLPTQGMADAGTYYSVGVGETAPSPYCTARDGHATWGDWSVDYGLNRLAYRLPYLNPPNSYLLRAVFYHEGRDTVRFSLLADSTAPTTGTVRPRTPDTVWVRIPRRAYRRTAQVACNIRRLAGDLVAVADLRLFQVEDQERNWGGGQSAGRLEADRPVLHQNAPNPFRTRTSIAYQLPEPSDVSVAILDATGRRIRKVAHGRQNPGHHVLTWDGRDAEGRHAAAGSYFIQLQTSAGTQTRRAVLNR
jgi:hypothetical protein